MAKLYLIRHAQSANNVLFNGSDHDDRRTPDPEITEIGQLQSNALGAHFADPEAEPRQYPLGENTEPRFGLTHLYCSLMTRSILTADYIAKSCGLKLQGLPNIFEKHGIFEFDNDGQAKGLAGPDRSYFEQRFPNLALPEDFNDAGWWNREAEDHAQFMTRMRKVVDEFQQTHGDTDDCVAMVVHGDFLDQFINELLSIQRYAPNYESDWVTNWTFHNASISRVDFVKGSRSMIYMNRIDHLKAQWVSW